MIQTMTTLHKIYRKCERIKKKTEKILIYISVSIIHCTPHTHTHIYLIWSVCKQSWCNDTFFYVHLATPKMNAYYIVCCNLRNIKISCWARIFKWFSAKMKWQRAKYISYTLFFLNIYIFNIRFNMLFLYRIFMEDSAEMVDFYIYFFFLSIKHEWFPDWNAYMLFSTSLIIASSSSYSILKWVFPTEKARHIWIVSIGKDSFMHNFNKIIENFSPLNPSIQSDLQQRIK